MKTKMWKKILSLALALVMALTLLPEPAWAAVAEDAPEWGKAITDAVRAISVQVDSVYTITTDTLPFKRVGDTYNLQLETNVPSPKWSLVSGQPYDVGLSIGEDGTLSGTATGYESGNRSVTFKVRAACKDDARVYAEKEFTQIVYPVNPYTVYLNPNGATNAAGTSYTSTTVSKLGGEVIDLSQYANLFPVYPCYVQTGWQTSQSGGSGAVFYGLDGRYTVQGSDILWARWTPIQYNVTYDLAGGTMAAGSEDRYAAVSINQKTGTGGTGNQPVTLPPAPTRDGYTFTGWSEDGGATMRTAGAAKYLKDLHATNLQVDYATPTAAADITFVAQWVSNNTEEELTVSGEPTLTLTYVTDSSDTLAAWGAWSVHANLSRVPAETESVRVRLNYQNSSDTLQSVEYPMTVTANRADYTGTLPEGAKSVTSVEILLKNATAKTISVGKTVGALLNVTVNGTPGSGALLRACQGGAVKASQSIDDAGIYVFNTLPAGSYTVEVLQNVSGYGYAVIASQDDVTLTDGVTTHVTLSATPTNAKTVKLTAQNSGGTAIGATFAWYADGSGTKRLASGDSYTFPANQTVYAQAAPKSSNDALLYEKSEITAIRAGSDDTVTLTLPDKTISKSAVSGTVKQGDTPLVGVTVAASQTYGGVSRTVTAVTNSSGAYSFTGDNALFSDAKAEFSVTSGGQRLGVTSGGTLSAPITDGASHDIAAGNSVVTASVTLTTGSTVEQVNRYLKALGREIGLKVTGSGTDTGYAFLEGTTGTVNATLYHTTGSSVNCTLSGKAFADETKSTTVTSGSGSVSFTPALYSGVVVSVTAPTTGSYFLAWYDGSGAYVGRSESCTLYSRATDMASVCPADTKTGNFTVVLVPDSFAPVIADATLSTLTSDQKIKQWNVTLDANAVTELDPYTVDSVTSVNAVYVTKPHSMLSANQESFASTGELLTFTGSIGLDDGLSNGKLTELKINARSKERASVGTYIATVTAPTLVINGVKYSGTNEASDMQWRYNFDGVDLPCDFTFYCRPANVSVDVNLAVTANVNYTGGYRINELIDNVTVTRPGASLSTLSTYVCHDVITVEGTAKPNEAVDLYDNDVFIATATADRFGEWTAQAPLHGVSDAYPTAHILYSVSASGVQSEELLVFHDKNGPELTDFTMSYRMTSGGPRYTIDVGDAYVFGGNLYDTTFTATFDHPDKLDNLEDAWSAYKAVFKVYTTDGEIRFLEAGQSGDIFTATVDTVLRSSVTRAEVLYAPKPTVNSDTYAAEHLKSLTVPDADNWRGDMSSVVSGEIAMLDSRSTNYTPFSGVSEAVAHLRANANAANNWSVTFDENGTASATGAEAGLDTSKLWKAYADADIPLRSISVNMTGSQSTKEWIESVAAKKLSSAPDRDMTYNSTRIFYDAEAFNAEKASLSAAFRQIAAVTLDSNASMQLFSASDLVYQDGELASGTYDISVAFLQDATSGLYMEYITVSLSMDFADFASGVLAAAPIERRLLLGAGPVSDGYMLSYQASLVHASGITFAEVADATERFLADYGLGLAGLGEFISHALLNNSITAASGFLAYVGVLANLFNAAMRIVKDSSQFKELMELRNSSCFKNLKDTQRAAVDKYFNRFVANMLLASLAEIGASAVTAIGSHAAFQLAVTAATATSATTAGISGAIALIATVGLWLAGKGFEVMLEQAHFAVDDAYQQCYMRTKQMMRLRAKQTGSPDCKGASSKDGNGKNNKVGNDPSGVVYEGVLENPVEGATVTLYYAADENGNIPTDNATPPNANNATAVNSAKQLLAADGVRNLIPAEATQVTLENGRYSWGVPDGLWYVTAKKSGYTGGDSNADIAATVSTSLTPATKLLPVLPVQLNVNIPLIDVTAPTVTTRVTTEGVYVTFSKYMVDEGSGGSNYASSVLNPDNYTLKIGDETVNDYTIQAVEQGHTASNRTDNNGAETYTRTVLLRRAIENGANVNLTVGSSVKSYAGSPMAAAYSGTAPAQPKTALSSPTFGRVSGEVERGTAVSISLPADAPAGTKLYYSTDGSAPATLYNGPVAITGDMTIKAVARCVGFEDSSVASASFTVKRASSPSPAPTPAPTPSPTPSGTRDADPGSSSVTVPVSGGAGTVNLNVTVSGGTAQVAPISGTDVAKAVAGGGNVSVVMDLSSLGGKIETVSIPDATLDRLTGALKTHAGSDSLTVKTANGSVKLSENAASAVADASNAGNVALTIKNSGKSGLNAAQKTAFTGRNVAGAYSLGVTANGRDVGTLGGGFAEISVPFTPTTGTKDLGYRAYHVAKDGTATVVPSAIHDGKLTVRSDRLSDIVAVYEPVNNTFADVAGGAYYADAVAWALANGVTNGMGDGLFAPDAGCARAQVVTFLWRAAGSPQPKNRASGFSDVSGGAYYSDAVAWAVENGVTNGIGDNLFGVDEICTRAQVVTFLCRMNSGRVSGRNPFVDVKAGAYYCDAVLWAYANDITNGTGDDRYSPDALCTRAQIVTFLYRDFVK